MAKGLGGDFGRERFTPFEEESAAALGITPAQFRQAETGARGGASRPSGRSGRGAGEDRAARFRRAEQRETFRRQTGSGRFGF